MYATDLKELHYAAEALEWRIREFKSRTEAEEPYFQKWPSGPMILAPMLADQITILNQLEKLEGIEFQKRLLEREMNEFAEDNARRD